MTYLVTPTDSVLERLRTGPRETFVAYLAVHVEIANDPWGGPSVVEGNPDSMSRERVFGEGRGFVDYVVFEHANEVHVVDFTWV